MNCAGLIQPCLVTTNIPFEKVVWVIPSGNQKKWVTKASGNNEANIPHHAGQNGCNDTQTVWSFYAIWGSCPYLQRDSESYQEMPLIILKKGTFLPLPPDPLVTTCWLWASLLISTSFKLFWWAKCLTFCCLREASGELWYCFNVLIYWPWSQGRVFPSPAISTAMDGADLQPAAMGITAALVYPGLPAEADDRAMTSKFHAKLIYAQVTWILRRKALVNHYKGLFNGA